MRRCRCDILGLLLLCCTHASPLSGQTTTVAYSFQGTDSGGIALAEIDLRDGHILANRVLLDSARCREPLKVRRTADGRRLVVTNVDKDGPHLFLVDPAGDAPVRPLSLQSVPDDVEVAGNLAIVSGEADFLSIVDLQAGKIRHEWDVGKTFTPPANAPEDVYVTRDQRYAVVSFQKDGENGKKRGNRLAIYQLPQLQLLADIELDRSRPDLHIEGNLTEQGPGPELIYVSDRTKTLLVTMDLYGVVGLTDWSRALQGKPLQWRMLSTSPKEHWGTAFPDRGCPLSLGPNDYFLVCNAGTEGGVALVSLQQQKVVWRRETPPGLETPVYLPSLKRAFAVCAGKTKRRTATEVEKESSPQQALYVFDFSSPKAVQTGPVETIPLQAFTFQIDVVSQTPPRLLLATGPTPKAAEQLVTYDPSARQILDEQPAAGRIGRLEGK